MKIIRITESQLKKYVHIKKNEAKIVEFIKRDIDKLKTKLNESMLNEGVVDVLKSYIKKGVLTVTIIASLLSSNYVNAQQLRQAGVSQDTIEQAEKGDKEENGMSNQEIENIIVRNLKKDGRIGSIKTFTSLPQEQKDKAIDFVRSEIKKGKNIDDILVSISSYVGYDTTGNDNVGTIDQKKVGEKIVVDTVYIQVTLPIKQNFKPNSSELNVDQVRTSLQDSLNSFVKVDSIVIKASSSTSRNTGEAEGLTWKELSQKRADALSNVIVGMQYNLGGKGVNPTYTVNKEIIKYDINGSNGDGTSGPPSPYEVNPSMVQSYKERGIDPKFWDSNSTGEPLADKADYEQYRYVNVIIYGQVVETHTENIINYRYIVANVQQKGGTVKKVKQGQKNVDISACPIKIKR